ncbi:hypothetical protein OG883_43245 [Streptomyces sp. NBC_01142]|uniref:hypothetical protein n=1 Tax=Streptomyces sp. NBC_01142 TaxID=2975865 RepID=UPI0022500BD8|nr:hypothetical protein [Streptomyces sp. NBC_01142]MCX4826458.1 hypothetical protein [Streptomyces sp. NBC_01142]
MSLLDKIKTLFRRRPAQTPDPESGNATAGNDQAAAPSGTGQPASSLENSIARGAAEGTAREVVRKFLEELFID